MSYIGKKKVAQIFAGEREVSHVYLGNELVFSKFRNYLTFTAEEDGATITLAFSSGSYEYKKTNGEWTKGTIDGTTTISLNQGESVILSGNNCTTDANHHISIKEGKIAASGDVTSLTNGKGGDCELTEFCYLYMFTSCSSLTSAPNLPSTTLAENCYDHMFYACGLLEAPELPATSLKSYCYQNMFNGCGNMTKGPDKLPATSLAEGCYYYMFNFCDSMLEAPYVSATELAESCCANMFTNCRALKYAPSLLATSVVGARGCYASMFSYCYSLITTPTLPEPDAAYCYDSMFAYCTSLKVSENGSGTKIFTRSGGLDNAVYEMFKNTAGSFTGTPTAGNTYYYY